MLAAMGVSLGSVLERAPRSAPAPGTQRWQRARVAGEPLAITTTGEPPAEVSTCAHDGRPALSAHRPVTPDVGGAHLERAGRSVVHGDRVEQLRPEVLGPVLSLIHISEPTR